MLSGLLNRNHQSVYIGAPTAIQTLNHDGIVSPPLQGHIQSATSRVARVRQESNLLSLSAIDFDIRISRLTITIHVLGPDGGDNVLITPDPSESDCALIRATDIPSCFLARASTAVHGPCIAPKCGRFPLIAVLGLWTRVSRRDLIAGADVRNSRYVILYAHDAPGYRYREPHIRIRHEIPSSSSRRPLDHVATTIGLVYFQDVIRLACVGVRALVCQLDQPEVSDVEVE